MTYQKFADNSNIVRDTNNKAVLASDINALTAHKKERERAERIDKMEKQINNIEKQLQHIVNLLSSKG